MTKREIIRKTTTRVKNILGKEGTGHDWWHIERVIKNAKHIAKREGGDLFVIELAALLHDIAWTDEGERVAEKIKGGGKYYFSRDGYC